MLLLLLAWTSQLILFGTFSTRAHTHKRVVLLPFQKKGKISFGNLCPQQKFKSFQITISTCFTKHLSLRGFQNHVFKKHILKKKKKKLIFFKMQLSTFPFCISQVTVLYLQQLHRGFWLSILPGSEASTKEKKREKYSILQIKQ